ncbi:MAG TPA: nitroreductase family protein [Anaerolineales bacterium]|nr:nitroreductase family protein [Anaerolineales bacterium]
MSDILQLIQDRRSVRAPFDPERRLAMQDVQQILEAARWSPTAHNMQNFEILVVDDRETLRKLGDIQSPPSEVFLRENFEQLSFSEEELLRKKVGVLGTMFPAAWRTPGTDFAEVARNSPPSALKDTLKGCPLVLIVVYDARKRAPASDGDVLGFISLGCLMENMWLAAQSLGIGLQIMSVFSGHAIEKEVKKILAVPEYMKIAFAARLGYAAPTGFKYLRVRRAVDDFAHHNRFGTKIRGS